MKSLLQYLSESQNFLINKHSSKIKGYPVYKFNVDSTIGVILNSKEDKIKFFRKFYKENYYEYKNLIYDDKSCVIVMPSTKDAKPLFYDCYKEDALDDTTFICYIDSLDDVTNEYWDKNNWKY